MKQLPSPGVLVTSTVPPIVSASSFTRASPETGAAATVAAVAAVEALEDTRQLVKRDALAGVTHLDSHRLGLGVDDYCDQPPGGCVADGVVHQVAYDLLQPLRIGAGRGTSSPG